MGLGEGINKPKMRQTLEHGKTAGPLRTGNLGRGRDRGEKGDCVGWFRSLDEDRLASPAPIHCLVKGTPRERIERVYNRVLLVDKLNTAEKVREDRTWGRQEEGVYI